jgi:hypothetical protein
MQTSRFQLGLIATLALGLGFSLASSEAIGYPAGSAISFRDNPVVSIGGTAYSDEAAKILFTAPADQDLIITDVVLSSTSNLKCQRTHKTEISTSSGDVLGQFETSSGYTRTWGSSWGASSDGRAIAHSYEAGLRVAAGDTLLVGVVQTDLYTVDGCGSVGSYGVRYSVSGYHSQP